MPVRPRPCTRLERHNLIARFPCYSVNKYEWQSRIKAVEREYQAMRQAADRFREAAQDDPTILRDDIRHREIVAASAHLEGTYLIRLFAEFETGPGPTG